MKLFIWEGVLTDYTDGMAVALAPDLETALATFKEKNTYVWTHPKTGEKHKSEGCVQESLGEPTQVIDLDGKNLKADAWYVWGGG